MSIAIKQVIMIDILVWVFGAGAMLSLFVMNQLKKRNSMLLAKLSADVCWGVHYLCLGAYGGMIPNVVGFFRELVFINRKKRKWASIVIWPIIFVLINLGIGISTFSRPINALPIVASSCATVVLWIDRPRFTKIALAFVSFAFLIYDIFVGSYIGILSESINLFSVIVYFTKEAIKRRKENEESIH